MIEVPYEFMVRSHPPKFDDHDHCDSEDIVLLATLSKCHVTLWARAHQGRLLPSLVAIGSLVVET